ncbi:peptide deformylase [Adhaeribacter pallidiroseus]|uniref:Peptide deformylase n=1 Tax=Adhaeribacter pallidiroseus TaxID=2072847 RepID=A0A369QH85_9BACT|nr:peptide deformylase [Adhaeribacter pallidiroseus]RDC63650.1 Peptide deformylase [Adhaeribacter pallidiroseus]
MAKGLQDLLLLGDPRLYQICEPVLESERPFVKTWVADLHQVMEAIRAKYHFGRGIAAPQLGIMKRLIYLNLDKPCIILNPEIIDPSPQLFELWDDCMCFANLLVKVKRHQSLTLKYLDENFRPQEWFVTDALAELIQHEYDHLEGILCTMRAVNDQAYRWRPTPD